MEPEGIPSISAISYGIDRILFPTIIWNQVPDLLDLLALAEEIRQKTVENANEALIWDELYRRDDSEQFVDGSNISQDDRAYLKKIKKLKNESTRRETYRTIVMNICLMVGALLFPYMDYLII